MGNTHGDGPGWVMQNPRSVPGLLSQLSKRVAILWMDAGWMHRILQVNYLVKPADCGCGRQLFAAVASNSRQVVECYSPSSTLESFPCPGGTADTPDSSPAGCVYTCPASPYPPMMVRSFTDHHLPPPPRLPSRSTAPRNPLLYSDTSSQALLMLPGRVQP